MTATGGYNSDTNLNNLNYVGDFPIENSLGGFGITTGSGNNYKLSLTPTLKQTYRLGLLLQVKFNHINTASASLNVDDKGTVPIKKVSSAGALVDVAPGDLNTTIHYILIYDGNFFQVASGIQNNGSTTLNPASETLPGIVRYATTAESNDAGNNTTGITPQKMIAYVANKVTGLWENKGLIDCSTTPNYPSGLSGDAYTVSVAGKIGGSSGVQVQANDVIHCLSDNPGGTQASVGTHWNVVQANLVPATEILAGIVKIATQTIVNTGADDSTAISPLKLKVRLDNYLNRETLLTISDQDLHPDIQTTIGRNHYTSINGNLIVCKDIRLINNRPTPANYAFVHILNFPKPLNSPTFHQPTVLISSEGNRFILQMDKDGKVLLFGTFTHPNEELILNLTPYISRFPLEYFETTPA